MICVRCGNYDDNIPHPEINICWNCFGKLGIIDKEIIESLAKMIQTILKSLCSDCGAETQAIPCYRCGGAKFFKNKKETK